MLAASGRVPKQPASYVTGMSYVVAAGSADVPYGLGGVEEVSQQTPGMVWHSHYVHVVCIKNKKYIPRGESDECR